MKIVMKFHEIIQLSTARCNETLYIDFVIFVFQQVCARPISSFVSSHLFAMTKTKNPIRKILLLQPSNFNEVELAKYQKKLKKISRKIFLQFKGKISMARINNFKIFTEFRDDTTMLT